MFAAILSGVRSGGSGARKTFATHLFLCYTYVDCDKAEPRLLT